MLQMLFWKLIFLGFFRVYTKMIKQLFFCTYTNSSFIQKGQ